VIIGPNPPTRKSGRAARRSLRLGTCIDRNAEVGVVESTLQRGKAGNEISLSSGCGIGFLLVGTSFAQHHWATPEKRVELVEVDPVRDVRNQPQSSPIDLAGFVDRPETAKANRCHRYVNNSRRSGRLRAGHAHRRRRTRLKQFHFHAPSENRIGGKQFPLEGHLVHADKDGNLAVVAVMFQEGAANPMLTKLWGKMPAKAGDKSALETGLSVTQLLPADRDYYRFNGSLTTPPCSEGVWWLVLKKPASASKSQVEQFSKTIGFANNRPIQPANARPVLR
jgi:carbonic anhydrase